jgi:hypothetical protein
MMRVLALVTAALMTVPCAGQELGRLFFSPAERAALDAEREAGATRPVAAKTPVPLRIDGYVRRSGGGATLWVNGAPLAGGSLEDVHMAPATGQPGEVVVTRRAQGSGLRVKVGSTFDAGSGAVLDAIEEGQLRVGR